MITDSRPIWDASLAEILSQPATPGTRASATDIPGVNLEWMATDAYPAGAWFGDCGQPTLAQLYALPTAYLAFGARASVLGVQYTYGAGVGWVADGNAFPAIYANMTLSSNLFDGSYSADNFYLDNNGANVANGQYAVSNHIPVNPGDKIIVSNGNAGTDKFGCFFSSGEFLSSIASAKPIGSITVPVGATSVKISIFKNQDKAFVYRVNPSGYGKSKVSLIGSIGDSICYGLKSSKNYTQLVAEYYGASVNNYGINTSTIANSAYTPISMRMSSIDTNSDLILFEGLANDWSVANITLGNPSDSGTTTFYGALNTCAYYLSRNFPLAKICWVVVPKWTNYANPNGNALTMDSYVTAFRAVANRFGFAIADCYDKINFNVNPDFSIASSDGAHPNDIGQYRIFETIIAELRR